MTYLYYVHYHHHDYYCYYYHYLFALRTWLRQMPRKPGTCPNLCCCVVLCLAVLHCCCLLFSGTCPQPPRIQDFPPGDVFCISELIQPVTVSSQLPVKMQFGHCKASTYIVRSPPRKEYCTPGTVASTPNKICSGLRATWP